jgi:hypothetical protein
MQSESARERAMDCRNTKKHTQVEEKERLTTLFVHPGEFGF